MSSVLASTLARCVARRARPVLAANPLVAAIAALLAVTTPPLAAFAGGRLGSALGPAVATEEGVAEALVLGLALTAAAAGALTALAAPGAAVLGTQLLAAPIRRLDAFLWLTLAPVALAAAVASAVAACVLVPVAAAAPGGAASAAPLLLAGLAAGALGAAAAAGILGAARGSGAGAVAAAGAAAVWALGVLAAGDPLTGPLGPAAEALRGHGDAAAAATLWAGAAAVAAAALWALAAVRLPEERHSRARVRAVLPLGGGPYVASALAAAKQLVRRRELRRAVGATTALAVGGAALLARGLGGAPEAGFVLAGAAALLGCAVVPAASYGVEREGAWLTDSSPVPSGRRASAGALAALGLALGLLALSLAGIRLVAPGSAQQFAALLAAGCVLFGAALASGTLLPWRADGALDQLAALAALGALALLLWLGLGELVGRATGAGVPRLPATGVALAVPIALGVGASAVAARRRRP